MSSTRSSARRAAACASLALLGLPGLASAEVSSSAIIQNFHVDVLDLTPTDASAAGYSFTNTDTWATASLVPDGVSPLVMSGQDREHGWFGAAVNRWEQGALYSKAASLNGALSASGRLADDSLGYYAANTGSFASWGGGTGLSSGLNVAPHTQLTLFADYRLDATIDHACLQPPSIGSICGVAQAGVYADGIGALPQGDPMGDNLDMRSEGGSAGSVSKSGTIGLTITNDSDEWKSQDVRFIATVLGQQGQAVAVVPEPAAGALMGMGLLVLGLAGRRRKPAR